MPKRVTKANDEIIELKEIKMVKIKREKILGWWNKSGTNQIRLDRFLAVSSSGQVELN